jgi:hypothetical protein
VALDQPAGTYYGQPVKGTQTCMYGIHVIGGPERPFSSMTPTEIEELHEQRRKEFWRNIDPATGLTDPSLPRSDPQVFLDELPEPLEQLIHRSDPVVLGPNRIHRLHQRARCWRVNV